MGAVKLNWLKFVLRLQPLKLRVPQTNFNFHLVKNLKSLRAVLNPLGLSLFASHLLLYHFQNVIVVDNKCRAW